MQAETLKETLLTALNIQSKAVTGRSNIPVLSNVLIKADTSKLYLYTTNLEINIISWIGATVVKPGSTTVSMKRFLDYINTLGEGNVALTLESNELHVVSKNNKAAFATIPSEEFPKVNDIKENPICSINSLLFFDAVNAVAFCASKDDTRPTFTGIYIEITPTYIDFVAIDGFRLAKKRIPIETGVASTLSVIVPSGYLEEIARMQGEKDEDVKLFVIGNKNQIGLRYKNSDFIIRLIEGVYPDYSRVIPEESTTEIAISRQALADAVRIATIFSPQKEIGKTQVKIETGAITLRSSQKEVGENETKIECEVKGETGIITYNSRFLQEAVSHFTDETIVMKVILKQEKPSILYNALPTKGKPFALDEAYFNLMTPIKIENE